jgi:serine/threonine protein kinase
MRFLHGSRPPILHGDLKARNILVDSKFRAKICDFGLSTKKRGNAISGTPFWLPPEYLRGEKEYDATCDMYSIGVILYEIFARKTPYEGENFKEVLRGVCSRGENKRPEIPKSTPPKFANLMKKCWSADPQFRPRAMDLDIALLDMDPSDAEPYSEDHAENQKRSGEMLYELFPKKVADQLRKGEKVEPESHELVTIIFSDIIHFTDISRTISPEKGRKDPVCLFVCVVLGTNHKSSCFVFSFLVSYSVRYVGSTLSRL